MIFNALVVAFVGLLPATLAAITAPKNFILQSKAIKGVSSSNQFNKQYLYTNQVSANAAAPLFTNVNGYAQFFSFGNPDVVGNETYYTLDTNTGYAPASTAAMEYNNTPVAAWEPVSFQTTPSGNFKPSQQQNGFYIGGTEHDMQLLWTNKYNNPQTGDFTTWLICEWSYLAPQLFFLVSNEDPTKIKLPSSCEAVYMQIVPAQSGS